MKGMGWLRHIQLVGFNACYGDQLCPKFKIGFDDFREPFRGTATAFIGYAEPLDNGILDFR